MAAIDFPASPTNGQQFTAPNGFVYQYSSTYTAWVAVGGAAGGALVSVGTTPPTSPLANQLWWNSELGQLFVWYNDGNTTQWVPVISAPASSGATGDFMASHSSAFTLSTTLSAIALNTVINGNVGNYYNPSTGRYTPPAGRYHIRVQIDGTTTGASNQVVQIRKNGVSIAQADSTVVSTNVAVYPAAEAQADANGTDYFEFFARSDVAGSWQGYFISFPISGIKGPAGDPGQLGWRLLGRVTPTAGQTQVDFTNLPSDVNDVMFTISNVMPQTNDVAFWIRCFDSAGAVDTGNNYFISAAASHTAAGTGAAVPEHAITAYPALFLTYSTSTNGVSNNAALAGFSADGKMLGIRNGAQRKFMNYQASYTNAGNATTFGISGGGMWVNATALLTGIRFLFSSGNFAAGGSIALWGSP